MLTSVLRSFSGVFLALFCAIGLFIMQIALTNPQFPYLIALLFAQFFLFAGFFVFYLPLANTQQRQIWVIVSGLPAIVIAIVAGIRWDNTTVFLHGALTLASILLNIGVGRRFASHAPESSVLEFVRNGLMMFIWGVACVFYVSFPLLQVTF